MTDLIERLEALTRPCAETDALIHAAVYVPDGEVEKSPINGAWCIFVAGYDGKRRLWEAQRGQTRTQPYTASIDAAMTLVPEGWSWSLFGPDNQACLVNPENPSQAATCDAATPAIALCIAALKARTPS